MSTLKARLMDEAAVRRAVARMAHEVIEKNHGVEDVCLVGIRRRGIPLAEMLGQNILAIEGAAVPVGSVDIAFYRDDLSHAFETPRIERTSIGFTVTGKRVVLVDDVLYTGRTARAALDAVLSVGRPASIQLAILIDRGHRELPIRADYVGKNVPTAHSEQVVVLLPPYDAEVGVELHTG
ncbi:MAG TPA: bifunctional pyr operon transcriptional regulator/uracil phosphoribosyltransferase PyrR [Clostridia bacterium]|nr:bifunctional pyr operon transcriptional regulator/uracil phosphoribosyltransferase PyrR [Clostridia bacterium]